MPAKKRKTASKRNKLSPKKRLRPKGLSNKSKKKIKRYVSAGLLTIISLVFLSGVWLFNYLNQNLALASNSYGYSIKDELFPTFVYGVYENVDNELPYLDKLQLVMLDNKSKRSYIYNIPVDMEYDIPGKFSNEEIRKILAFGTLTYEGDESKNVLFNLIFKLFGFKTTNYILVQKDYAEIFDKFIAEGSIYTLMNKNLINEFNDKVETNFNIREIYQLSVMIDEIPINRVFKKEFISSYLTNKELLDGEIQEFTINSPLNTEKKAIAVLNGTKTLGTASSVARVIKNLGGRIVEVSNTDIEYDESFMIVDDLSSESLGIISNMLGIKKILLKTDNNDFSHSSVVDKSDILVVIGFDISEDL